MNKLFKNNYSAILPMPTLIINKEFKKMYIYTKLGNAF